MGSQKNHYMQFPVRTLSGNKNFENSLALIINKADGGFKRYYYKYKEKKYRFKFYGLFLCRFWHH
jgi:hypothetical protein